MPTDVPRQRYTQVDTHSLYLNVPLCSCFWPWALASSCLGFLPQDSRAKDLERALEAEGPASFMDLGLLVCGWRCWRLACR